MKVIFPAMKNEHQIQNLDKTGDDGIRINKFIAAAGYCSRRQADKFIEQGLVSINHNPAKLGSLVYPQDEIRIYDDILQAPKQEDLIYLAFNKPQGVICTANPDVKNNIIDFIDYPERVFTIGRLDKDSEGLILLTNNGAIFNKIVRAEYEHEKEYLVEVNRPFDQNFLKNMANGVKILDTVTNPAKIKPLTKTKFKLTITQGLNRQIRRMCEALGYRVIFLKRIRILNIKLASLPLGKYRPLMSKELSDLFAMIDYP